jgi:ABC-type glycerol-3-phosphate transport system permease component
MIDGALRFAIFRKVVLPISCRALASAFLLMLILTWNEYLLALMPSTADTQTLPLLIAAERDPRAAVVVHVGADPDHDRAGGRDGGRPRALHPRGMLIGAVKG